LATAKISNVANSPSMTSSTAPPGDTLRVELINPLGTNDWLGGIDNFHTHCLIVATRPSNPPGDYICGGPAGDDHILQDGSPRNLPGIMFSMSAICGATATFKFIPFSSQRMKRPPPLWLQATTKHHPERALGRQLSPTDRLAEEFDRRGGRSAELCHTERQRQCDDAAGTQKLLNGA
jgi:hypothetical protein